MHKYVHAMLPDIDVLTHRRADITHVRTSLRACRCGSNSTCERRATTVPGHAHTRRAPGPPLGTRPGKGKDAPPGHRIGAHSALADCEVVYDRPFWFEHTLAHNFFRTPCPLPRPPRMPCRHPITFGALHDDEEALLLFRADALRATTMSEIRRGLVGGLIHVCVHSSRRWCTHLCSCATACLHTCNA